MTSSPRNRSIIVWVLAIVITLASVVYQRMTGPTHPVRGDVTIGGEVIKFKLLRSHETTADAEMRIKIGDPGVTGELIWKRYKSDDEWMTRAMVRQGDELVTRIPKQPSAGKVIYRIVFTDAGGHTYQASDEPVIMRFKGVVPKAILIPHIILMFSAMLVSTRAGLEALTRGPCVFKQALYAAVFLFLGGMILGPLVQKFAFGAYWTGWPFGHDLTDNKTAFALLFWIIALWRTHKDPEKGRIWVVIAAVVQLLVYLIPHSVLGSEIDYTKTK